MAESKGFFRCTPVHLRSLITSAKTVHRTVLFRRQVCSLLVRIPLFIFTNAKSRPCDLLFVLAESPSFIRNYFMGVQLRFREVALLYRNHEIDLLPGIKIPLGIYPRWYDKRDLLVK